MADAKVMIVVREEDDPVLFDMKGPYRVELVDGDGVARLVLRGCRLVDHVKGPDGAVYIFEKDG